MPRRVAPRARCSSATRRSPSGPRGQRGAGPTRWPLRAALALVLSVAASLDGGPVRADWMRILGRHGFRRDQVGLVVLDGAGEIRASINGSRAFAPASNMKVLVAATALYELGPGFEYETVLWSDRAPRGGTLEGDLVVTGNGDPNISGRFTGGDPLAIFRHWARSLVGNGVRRISGDILVDDFLFEGERFLPGWNKKFLSRWYAAQVGALNLNDNCVDFTVFPASPGRPVAYRMSPRTDYVDVENECLTRKGGDLLIGLDRFEGTNRIRLSGELPVRFHKGTKVFHVTVEDPGLFFGTVLHEVFASEGIDIAGTVVRDRARIPPASRRIVLHRHRSSLARDLPVILQNSQNLHAEILLRLLGTRSGRPGSVESGAAVVRRFLNRVGAPIDGLHIADGSGLSPGNRVTPGAMARVLHWLSLRPDARLFTESLACAGRSGTLENQFRGSPLRGLVHAKTGYITGVSCLSGYVARRDSEADEPAPGGGLEGARKERGWVFSILINGFPRRGGLHAARQLQEDIVEEIDRYME